MSLLDYFDPYDWYEDGYRQTDWERKSERMKVSAPDPDDLCEGCGRSHRLCDCFDGED